MSAAGGDETGAMIDIISDAAFQGAVNTVMKSVPRTERNIPHADGSREYPPVARVAIDPVDAALDAFNLCAERERQALRAVTDAVTNYRVEVERRERASARYLELIDAREDG